MVEVIKRALGNPGEKLHGRPESEGKSKPPPERILGALEDNTADAQTLNQENPCSYATIIERDTTPRIGDSVTSNQPERYHSPSSTDPPNGTMNPQ